MVESIFVALIYNDYSTKYDRVPVDTACIISTSDISFVEIGIK